MGEGIGGLTQRLSSAEKRKISTAQPLSEPGSQPPKATNENDDENDLNENVPRFARSPPASQFRPSHSAGGLASLEQSFSWLNVDELKRQKYNREKVRAFAGLFSSLPLCKLGLGGTGSIGAGAEEEGRSAA